MTKCTDTGLGQSWKENLWGWQDDRMTPVMTTRHIMVKTHHGSLEAWLKKQFIFSDLYLYSVAVMIVSPSHWDTVIFKLSKKVIYTLSLPDIYLLVPCPRCPMSSYINGGWEALEGHGNDANHDHSQIWQYASHFSETVTQTQTHRDSQDIIYWTSEWFLIFEYLLNLPTHSESYLFCYRRWWWYSNDPSSDRFWWKMLSILVNNGSFLGHLTLRSNAKSVSDGDKGNQTVMSSQAQLWGMYQWADPHSHRHHASWLSLQLIKIQCHRYKNRASEMSFFAGKCTQLEKCYSWI